MSDKKSVTRANMNSDSLSLHRVKTTPEVEEGPYYKPDSPQRTGLYEAGIPGERLILTGHVLDLNDKPVPHAWLDFWQANGRGEYDNSGFILRGHQYADKDGKYTLETVIPGGYSFRTPHIHVKVRATDSSAILTTQLFFPGLASNKTDYLFRDETQMELKNTPQGKEGTFNFKISR